MLPSRAPWAAALAVCAVLAAAHPAGAQARDSARRTLAAAPATGGITVDGRLDEAAWAAAAMADGFTQSWPNPGAAATERSEARVLFDDKALYVGVRMYDAHADSIAAQLARRDATGIYSDWVHVTVDSYNDRRTGFRFSLNPRGVQKDVYHYDDGNEDLNWDAVWQSATTVDGQGWTAEIRIPLSQIRFSGPEAEGGRTWGLQVQRDIARRNERSSWNLWTRDHAGYVSSFGLVTGLKGIQPVRRLEIMPYVSSRLTRAPGDDDDPFYSANDVGASIGGDVKLGITSGLTLTATVNPDFGQVEVDPAVVNLSAFETFFPEKRPFFVEGADAFRFGNVRVFNSYGFQEFFYTRRLGREPQRFVDGDSIRFRDVPSQSTILGAAKLSGKVGNWTVGLMDAVTAEERARIRTDARTHETPVEPLTNYLVGRVRRDFRSGASTLGAMATGTWRDLADGLFSPVLRSRAMFAGVDGQHSWDERRWTLSGYVAASRVHGSTEVITAAQESSSRYYDRPDADYLSLDPDATSLGGHMMEFGLQRSGALHGSLHYKEASPGFEINDLGFMGRTDYRTFNTLLGYQWNEPGWLGRDGVLYGYTYHAWNFGGDAFLHGGSLGSNITFHNFMAAGLQAGWRPETEDDRLTRGGPTSIRPSSWDLSGWVDSDSRKAVQVGVNAALSRNTEGGEDRSFGGFVTYRPTSAVRLQVGPSYSRSFNRAQFVRSVTDAAATETYGARYVFGDLRQTTLSMDTRLDWTFTPTLSLQLFAQPFVAAGDFSGFKELEAPGTFDFAVYGRDRGTIRQAESCDAPAAPGSDYVVDPDGAGPGGCFSFGERDFNVRSLRGNAVLRWEYRPGSVLFFVWQQQRDGFDAVGDFDFGRDTGELFSAPARNVFLLKATYWLGR
jgi:hypothetical protein